MDNKFWITAWNEGRTNFHQADYHDKLIEYFPHFHPTAGQKVLVPLCGKSKDLIWLTQQKLSVHGIELHEPAVISFFEENGFPTAQKVLEPDFIKYSSGKVTIRTGDFFKFKSSAVYDYIYDRAALVALPAALRKDYARVLTESLKVGGKYLLIVYEYDQSLMEGPPFSVSTDEVHALYADHFTIKLVEDKTPVRDGPRVMAVPGLKQKVYVLRKTV